MYVYGHLNIHTCKAASLFICFPMPSASFAAWHWCYDDWPNINWKGLGRKRSAPNRDTVPDWVQPWRLWQDRY